MNPDAKAAGDVDFWFATFDLHSAAAETWSPVQYALGASSDTANHMAVELISIRRNGNRTASAVLISTADSGDDPHRLVCRAAYSNCIEWADRLREQGFRTVEASILWDDSVPRVRVFVPFFAPDTNDHTARESTEFLTLRIDVDPSAPKLPKKFGAPTYYQAKASPSMALPKTELAVLEAPSTFDRFGVNEVGAGGVSLTIAAARFPRLMPIAIENLPACKVWNGKISTWPPLTQASPPVGRAARSVISAKKDESPKQVQTLPPTTSLGRRRRDDELGPSAYVFKGVESIGFRIDASQIDDDFQDHLRGLLEPLNFHISEGHTSGLEGVGTTAFEYRAATSTVTFELLRYDKMLFDRSTGMLGPEDYVSQHELVVRVLVGRVDDDTAQARDPAIFVPAIFVDNPWSKLVGREMQGFDKVLADFCTASGPPLTMQGFEPGSAGGKRKLGEVSEVRLVSNRNFATDSSATLMQIAYPHAAFDSDSAFGAFDLRSQLGSGFFSGSRWRQDDFQATEFRRSFARSVIDDGLNRFRSIQVSPIDERGLPKAWIRGSFELDDLRVTYPTGVSTLTLKSPPGAPSAWRKLCNMFAGEPLSVTTGDWYRLRCSMKLTIADGLE